MHAPVVPSDEMGFNHLVHLQGIEGDRVLVADPAFGNCQISAAELEGTWLEGLAFLVSQ